uniref:G_PROTEIN_RECEP_F1_2 domain-containing protein n=1 Tax=Parastrongyloides trichosuri TaxID=131310 RepID=A0A0N5A423_PARTI
MFGLTNEKLQLVYVAGELTLSIFISASNLLVLWVFIRNKFIRTATNTYIFSLALTDFLAGAIGIPFTVYTVITKMPNSFIPCLSVHLILCTLCTISTFHLLAMAIDKYITICSPLNAYTRFGKASRKLRTVIMITSAWLFGLLIGILPLFEVFGFSAHLKYEFNKRNECSFLYVVDERYLVYVIFFTTIIIPTFIISYCYAAIYSRIRFDEAQVSCLLRASDRQKRIRNRKKIIRTLLILVATYAICWYPLYIINTADHFLTFYQPSLTATYFTVWLSHVCCAINPLIYAYGMPGFKICLRSFIRSASQRRRTGLNTSFFQNDGQFSKVAFDVLANRSESLNLRKSSTILNNINNVRKYSVQDHTDLVPHRR